MVDHNGPTTVDAAAEVLAAHVAEDGWCRGCRDLWGRLVPYPCTQAEWATRIREDRSAASDEVQ
jgi:hypothetical protein